MSKPKSSPTSMLKFLRVVQSCTADLTDGERLVLWALAIEADYKTGRNSHPGNTKLMRVTGRKSVQGILHIIRKLLAKCLIEKTKDGHPDLPGQPAEAAWYRICLEHPAFPDPETMKAQTFTVSESTMKAESADRESNHPPTMKVEGADHESPDFHYSHNPSHKSLPPSPPVGLVGRLRKLGQDAGVDLSVPGNAKRPLLDLAVRDGDDKVEAKCGAWLRTASFVGLNQPPVFKFLREYDDIDETATVRDPLPTMADVDRLNRVCEAISQRDRAKSDADWEQRKQEIAWEEAHAHEI